MDWKAHFIEKRSKKQLREFALVMFLGFSILALIFWAIGKGLSWNLLTIAGVFAFFGVVYPRILYPVDRLWMAFGFLIGLVMTRVVLVIIFFGVMTPMGLLARLVGRDELDLRYDSEAKSHWTKIPADGPGSRPYLPY